MPALHIIDVARIFHETRRAYLNTSTDQSITAAWGDLPEDRRGALIADVQRILDDQPVQSSTGALGIAVVNALRPFVEE